MRKIPRSHKESVIPLGRFLYDFALCDGIAELQQAIEEINENGYRLVSVSQHEHTYTVFFRRYVNA